MKNNIKKALVKFWEDLLYSPLVKFWEDLLYSQHFMQIFVFAPN